MHEIFDGKEQRSRAIIISSYSTYSLRHGPLALRKHRMNKHAMSKTKADKIRMELDPVWEGSALGALILDREPSFDRKTVGTLLRVRSGDCENEGIQRCR